MCSLNLVGDSSHASPVGRSGESSPLNVEEKSPFFLRPVAKVITGKVKQTYLEPQISQQLGYMEAELEKNTWFVSDEFTAADIQLSFPLEAAASQSNLDAGHPQLKAFLERIHARPAYQKAIERGGSYDFSTADFS